MFFFNELCLTQIGPLQLLGVKCQIVTDLTHIGGIVFIRWALMSYPFSAADCQQEQVWGQW